MPLPDRSKSRSKYFVIPKQTAFVKTGVAQDTVIPDAADCANLSRAPTAK
jgi:hypothetical protein